MEVMLTFWPTDCLFVRLTNLIDERLANWEGLAFWSEKRIVNSIRLINIPLLISYS